MRTLRTCQQQSRHTVTEKTKARLRPGTTQWIKSHERAEGGSKSAQCRESTAVRTSTSHNKQNEIMMYFCETGKSFLTMHPSSHTPVASTSNEHLISKNMRL